ncbi:GNAT family N-acetyltransferase [Paractinoplanes toevensis]|uniref:N-acetyltransferase n=1 Tax=Paractinoplanes toevensis TaxID=571911 RepID=A0A919THQ3_9ACTN|nr:GNAT family N-acetyltransferase [Actinoplanes toevensis]GIM95608.1 N-acetyltransferase [Actinoplanes toevensis]
MSWELTADLDDFVADAGEFLRSRPVQHTVFLTLIDTLRRRGLHAYGSGDPVFGVWRAGSGAVDGVLLQTPPYPMNFSALPAAAVSAAVPALAGRSLSGANLPAEAVDEFVAGWREQTGAGAAVKMRTRLYLLDTLLPFVASAGHSRAATANDRELLQRWHVEFHDEIYETHSGDFGEVVDERLDYGGIVLWEVDGVPVSMALRSRLSAGMIRVQMVYTPREHRGRGYAGSATTVVTRDALDQGAEAVVLVTDLANPTSNGLYQRLGYKPIEDRVVVEFS